VSIPSQNPVSVAGHPLQHIVTPPIRHPRTWTRSVHMLKIATRSGGAFSICDATPMQFARSLHRGVLFLRSDLHLMRRCLPRREQCRGIDPMHPAQSRLRRRLQHHRTPCDATNGLGSGDDPPHARCLRRRLSAVCRRVREARADACALQDLRRGLPKLHASLRRGGTQHGALISGGGAPAFRKRPATDAKAGRKGPARPTMATGLLRP